MVIYDLICQSEHKFEAWFQDSESYSEQIKSHLVQCPHCGDSNVRKIISGGHFRTRSESKNQKPTKISEDALPKTSDLQEANVDPVVVIKTMNKYIKDHFQNVGEEFVDKAIAMHEGEAEAEPIYGTADSDGREQLEDAGVAYIPIPKLPENFEN